MTYNDFVNETHSWWTKYFEIITTMQKQNMLVTKGGTILYPNILIVTNCSGYYVAELIGAVKSFNGLRIKWHNEKSIYRYLSQFDDQEPDPVFAWDGYNTVCTSMCLAHNTDLNEVAKRFPHLNFRPTVIKRVGGKGSVFAFKSNFLSHAIVNCVLVNRHENIIRCKSILSAFIVSKRISKLKLHDLFKHITSDNTIVGIHTTFDNTEENLIVAGQLQSLYLFPNLRETTIGEYINLHPNIVKSAFKTTHFEYEPYLEWIEHDGSCTDKAINPDLMIKRKDGYYDIYDLKTALMQRDNITKGNRKRRRFIDYVEEGVAQLANYREYFNYTKNADYARDKYGIEICNPKLVLIVGTWENSSFDEVSQACRRYNNIEIIDYDTFCHMFIGTST